MGGAGVGAGRIGAVRGAQRVAALGGFRAVATVAVVAAAMVMPVGSQDNDDPYADNGGVDIRGMERASECLLPVAWRSTPCVTAINKFERDLLLECGDCMFQSRRALQGFRTGRVAAEVRGCDPGEQEFGKKCLLNARCRGFIDSIDEKYLSLRVAKCSEDEKAFEANKTGVEACLTSLPEGTLGRRFPIVNLNGRTSFLFQLQVLAVRCELTLDGSLTLLDDESKLYLADMAYDRYTHCMLNQSETLCQERKLKKNTAADVERAADGATDALRSTLVMLAGLTISLPGL